MTRALARFALWSGIILLESLLVFALPRYLAGVAAAYFASLFAWESLRPGAHFPRPLGMLLAGILLAGAIAAWGQNIGSVGAWRTAGGIAGIVLLAPAYAFFGRWFDRRPAG